MHQPHADANAEHVWLNEVEAAQHCGLSYHTLRIYRYRGVGPLWVRMGRRVLYLKSWLDEWLMAHAVKSTSQADERQRREREAA